MSDREKDSTETVQNAQDYLSYVFGVLLSSVN